MSTEQKEDTTTGSSNVQADRNVRRPDQDIRRPRLRVKPVGSRDGAAARQARKRNGTLFEGEADSTTSTEETTAQGDAARPEQPSPAEESAPDEDAPKDKKVVVPPLQRQYPYATYRSAPTDPEDEAPEQKQASAKPFAEREISTGFLLGVALVVVVLVGGIWVARLQNRVAGLEARISQLEGPPPAEAPAAP